MADGPYTYYVDSVAGVDANPGTQALPWKTITKVNAALAANQSVGFKRGGSYAGQLTPVTGVTYGAWGSGANPIINGAGQAQCVLAASVNNLAFQDLRLTGATNYGLAADVVSGLTVTGLEVDHVGSTGIILGNGTANAVISNCLVHDNGSGSGDRNGIGIGGGGAAPHDIIIQGCDIYFNNQDNIRVSMTSAFATPFNITIRNNTVRNSVAGGGIAADAAAGLSITFNLVLNNMAGVGIYVVPASDGTHIENVAAAIYHNTVVGNGYGLLATNGASGTFNVVVKNNLFSNNALVPGSSAEMGITTLTTWVSDYNLVYHAAGGTFMFAASYMNWATWKTTIAPHDANSKNADPKLNADYTLQVGSPALAAGVFISGVSLSNPPDIGARGLGAAGISFDFTAGALPPGITLTRASTGTYFTAGGILTVAAINAPRFNYIGSVSHLLAEPAATNLLLYSNAFNNGSGWFTANGAVVAAAQFVSPDGTNNGFSLTAGSGFGSVGNYTVTFAAGPYTASAWVKRITGSAPHLFKLSSLAWGGDIPTSAALTRVSSTIITPAGAADTVLQVDLASGTNGIFGAQVEAGIVPTSYIPTTSAPATRAVDVATFTIPADVAYLTYTFDDNTTQTVAVSPGSYTIPTNLNRANIKTIVGSLTPPPSPPLVTFWRMTFKTPYAPTAPIASIPWSTLTHLANVGYQPNTNGSLTDISLGEHGALISAGRAAGVKTLICIADVAGGDFSGAINNNLATLVANIVNVVNVFGYDGVDIDAERTATTAQMATLINALRPALGSKLLSLNAGYFQYTFWNASNTSVLDRLNLMAYDLASTVGDPYSWFHSCILSPNPAVVWSADLIRTRFLANGVPAAKMNLGIPFYGYRSSGGAITGPRQTYGAPLPTFTQLNYPVVLSTYPVESAAPTIDLASGGTPWFPISGGWVQWDTPAYVAAKARYAATNGLGGIASWSLDMGYVASGATPAEKHPLLTASQASPSLVPVTAFASLSLIADTPVRVIADGSMSLVILNTGPGKLYISTGATPGVNAQSMMIPALQTAPPVSAGTPVWLSADQSGGVSILAVPR